MSGAKTLAGAREALAIARGEAGPVVLVCGGRAFADVALLRRTLDEVHATHGVGVLVEGGAGKVKREPGEPEERRGADLLAHDWASAHGIPVITTMADWKKLGLAAGPIRNQRMLDEHHPDLVIAFPGGKGTADCVRRARAMGIEVVEVKSCGSSTGG